MRRRTALALIVLGLPVLLGFAAGAVQGWHWVFDDAFITYRYARNLASGYGVTWNPGEPPTEGYTNFLLVVLLAPFIKVGADPLAVTRVLSYASALGVCALVWFEARRGSGCSPYEAITAASLVLLSPQTRALCLVGLETVIYALVLLAAFRAGVTALDTRRLRPCVTFAVLVILAMLLRPEAAILYVVTAALYLARPGPGGTREAKALLAGSAVALVLGGAYVGWKLAHFGRLLPNPFYLKMGSGLSVSPLGLHSVAAFARANLALLAVALGGLVLRSRAGGRSRERMVSLLGLTFLAADACFFARTDTLMDVDGRFLYPLVPILVVMCVPALRAALAALDRWSGGRTAAFAGALVLFLLVFAPGDLVGAYANVRRLEPDDAWKTSDSLMQKEYRIAKALAAFPGIGNVRIAFGDSGVIPYFTGAPWLDVAGLNDGVIARTRDGKALVDHFFGFEADLVIHPGGKDGLWVTYGHGPLGDYESWAGDPRWDAYAYVGTARVGGPIYDLQFFVRRTSPRREALTAFLRRSVVDGWYEPLPYRIGSWPGSRGAPVRWVPREAGSLDITTHP